MTMYWYDSAWKTTTNLYAYDSSTWKEVLACWIHDGIDWRIVHQAPSSLDSATVTDTSCSPTLGNYSVAWTYSSPNIADWIIRIEAQFSGGGYQTLVDNLDPTTSPYADTLDGFAGFTSLDNTDFRISLLDASSGTLHATNSPLIRSGPFSC
jgi:hypothetical protein